MRVENLCPKDLEFGDPAVLVLHIPLEGEEGDNNVCLNKGKKKKTNMQDKSKQETNVSQRSIRVFKWVLKYPKVQALF